MSQKSRPSASTAAAQQASSASTSSQGTTCAICLDRMSDRSVAIPCCHEFDYRCISEWAVNHSLCPVCRRSMDCIHHNIKSNTEYSVHPVIPQHNDEDDYHDEDSDDDSDVLSDVSGMSDLAGFNIQFGPVMINFENSSESNSSDDDNIGSHHSDDNVSDIFGDSSDNGGDDVNEQDDDDDADDEEEEMDGDDVQSSDGSDIFQEIEDVVDATNETIDLSSDEDGDTRGNSTVNISNDDDHYDTPSDYGDEPVEIHEEDVYEEANDYTGFDEDYDDQD